MVLHKIQQGAEALILLDKKQRIIIKRRIKKSYRIPEIDDRIRKLRTRSEAKLLEKASKAIFVPKVLKFDEKGKEIALEFIDGKKLSEHLDNFSLNKQKEICMEIGKNTAKLHNLSIIHGDLTTSNMILTEKNGQVYFIDFGLGFISHKFEDKAVDIHLLKQAIEAKHFKNWKNLFNEFLKGYKNSKDYKIVLERLKKVEKRRRYGN